MSYRLWVLISGVIAYIGSFVCLQSHPTLRGILCMFCAFIMGVGIVLVGNKFADLKKEVEELRKQIVRMEKEKSDDKGRSN